jgi:Double zinc ribbon
MKCSKCQFENSPSAKFCVECGGKLAIVCQNCTTSNHPNHKFCSNCGIALVILAEPSLKDLSFDDKLGKIQKYLPKGITEKILSQKDKIQCHLNLKSEPFFLNLNFKSEHLNL